MISENINDAADSDWIRQSFFMPSMFPTLDGDGDLTTGLTAGIRYKEPTGRRFSSSELKYTDTTPGGNNSMNPKPQFTRWCDPKMPGLNRSTSTGMGEYYADAIDDNAQRIFLQFGVPAYNSLTNYISRFYKQDTATLVNTGKSAGILWFAGYSVGLLLTGVFQAADYLYDNIKRLWKGAINKSSAFYYMKPTMPMYWAAVTAMLNRITVNMGMAEAPAGGTLTDDAEQNGFTNVSFMQILRDEDKSILAEYYPNIFLDNGGIDVMKVASRAQQLANAHHRTLKRIIDEESKVPDPDYATAINKYLSMADGYEAELPSEENNIYQYLNDYYVNNTIGRGVGVKLTPDPKPAGAPANAGEEGAYSSVAIDASQLQTNDIANAYREFSSDESSMFSVFESELKDGSAFVSFIVDYEGTSSESFSNSTKTSEIESTINSQSSAARSAMFNIAGGNVGDNIFTDAVEGFLGGVASAVNGALAGVGLGGLASLGGGANADIPEFWDESVANAPSSSYTVRLSTPYGNKLSILLDIFMPLCMLLAGALPRSTGQKSYSSPFLCRLHSTGRNVIKLGIIDSISISRGEGGVGWSVDGLPTAIDVTFSIKNLSRVMHMPIDELSGPLTAAIDAVRFSILDEDTLYTDYLAAITGVDLYDQYYHVPRIKLKLAQQMANLESSFELSRAANKYMNQGPLAYAKNIFNGGQRFF